MHGKTVNLIPCLREFDLLPSPLQVAPQFAVRGYDGSHFVDVSIIGKQSPLPVWNLKFKIRTPPDLHVMPHTHHTHRKRAACGRPGCRAVSTNDTEPASSHINADRNYQSYHRREQSETLSVTCQTCDCCWVLSCAIILSIFEYSGQRSSR